MKIAAIQTFLSVVHTRNLISAAEELNVTQSAVSARLDALEESLGQTLLVRSRKGAKLTKAGFAFLGQAETIANTWENAKACASLPKGLTNIFSLACDPNLWVNLAETWVKNLRAAHPDTAFEIWSSTTREAEEWLQSGVSDAALLHEQIVAPNIVNRVFSRDRLVLVSSVKREVTPWDPAYIYIHYGPEFRRHHVQAWPQDETARVAFNAPDWALRHLLRTGGSAYLPDRLAKPHLDDQSLFTVEGAEDFHHLTYLSWRESHEEKFPWIADQMKDPELA